MKVSESQKKVLRLMAEGWALGTEVGIYNRAWLQRDGLGRGGPVEYIRSPTVEALCVKKLIVAKRTFPNTTWSLTKQGKEVAESLCK